MHWTLVWSLVVTAVCLSLVAGLPSGAAERRCGPDPDASSVQGRALCPFFLSNVTVFDNVELLEATLDPLCPKNAWCGPEGKKRKCTPVWSVMRRDGFNDEEVPVAFVCASPPR
ncbi:hypothetical protein FJT64_016316 [Amphibalanus amphitrite]|uniref:CLIP domain-containing serine protease n=1 Tax=Amphibalanus amphitrite TaxID=1232801 RepID=A0A6A4XF51_AMPAM|nr:hypothetical protein FJT64_016316 [Amphibalanus amphitrite]